MSALCSAQADPAWWTTRNVVETNAPISDFSPVNLGQLKWMATNAMAELEEKLPGGAGTNILNLVGSFSLSDNFRVVNVGQLKYTAKSFYDRLIAEGYCSDYPWTAATTDDVDYAMANIGQLKYLFSFDLSVDSDGDGMPDWWELHYFGNLAQTASGDYDSDGLTNLAEYQHHTNPALADTDGDGINDGTEVANGTDPNNNDTTVPVITVSTPDDGTIIRELP